VYNKSPAAETIITKALEANILMKELSVEDRTTLMKAMNTVKFKPGQQIIKQGDEGDKFYVIGAGTCDITVKGKGSVMKASRGVAFGELALMFHQPRAATVTAEGDVVAWQVDDITFKHILMNNWKPPVNKKTKACESFLTKVLGENLLFKELAPADRQVLMKAMQKVKFVEGEEIITQGDRGDKFYVLESGTCDITVKGKGSVMKASRGVAFGELALMFNQPRAATVTAEGDVVAWQVDAVTFKSFMESPVSTDGNALTELTNSLQPTSQCMRNITMCGLSAPRR
jgi:cAMP-dependent protein kinase regulator